MGWDPRWFIENVLVCPYCKQRMQSVPADMLPHVGDEYRPIWSCLPCTKLFKFKVIRGDGEMGVNFMFREIPKEVWEQR